MKDYIKTGLVLMSFMIGAAFLVTLVYIVTEPYIQEAEFKAKLEAIETVLYDYKTGELLVQEIPRNEEDLNKHIWKQSENNLLLVKDNNAKVHSPAYKIIDNNLEIYILTISGVGYGGDVVSIVSFVKTPNDFYFNNMQVIDLSQETPGLGARIGEREIQDRIVEEARKNNYQIPSSDIITGATITVDGVSDSIKIVVEFFEKEGVI